MATQTLRVGGHTFVATGNYAGCNKAGCHAAAPLAAPVAAPVSGNLIYLAQLVNVKYLDIFYMMLKLLTFFI